MEKANADVEGFFSKFDEEEIVDKSESLTDKEESDTNKDKDKASLEDKKAEDSKGSDKSEDKTDDDADKDKNTPFHEHPRWKKMLKDRNDLRESKGKWDKEKEELNGRIAKLESKPLTDEELEGMTPKEIQEHTRKEMERDSQLKQEISEKEKANADQYIEDTLNDIKDAGFEFNENKLLKIAEEYTGGDIEKAFDLYQKLGESKEEGASQEAKNAAKKKAADSNKSNRGSGGKSGGFVSGTSWDDLDLK